jgi:hypothetical protein
VLSVIIDVMRGVDIHIHLISRTLRRSVPMSSIVDVTGAAIVDTAAVAVVSPPSVSS